jgi:DNA-binding MarR family transcriptional regulator
MLRIETRPDRPPDVAAEAVPALAVVGLERFAPYLLNRITQCWNASMQTKVKAHGLSIIQMRTLAVLSVMPGATVNELAVHTVTEQSTMSRALDGMVREGLVRRAPRRGNMRVRELHPTEKGIRAFERVWPVMHAAFKEMFAGISEEEYDTLIALLERVLRSNCRNGF